MLAKALISEHRTGGGRMKIFYQALNAHKETNRRKRWENHRTQITELIRGSLPDNLSAPTAIILGAGNCDDLDLKQLSDLFTEITLSDIDGEATRIASDSVDQTISGKIKIDEGTDYTKLDQIDFYHHFQQLLEDRAEWSRIVTFLQEAPKRLEAYDLYLPWKHHFQVVISSAVYTQIFYIEALSRFAKYAQFYTGNETNCIVQALAQLRDAIISQYNDLLLSLVQPGGQVIVWTDVWKVEESERALIAGMLSMPEGLLEFIGHHGIQAALSGLRDLKQKLQAQNLIFRYWLWPFSEEKELVTFGLAGKPFVYPLTDEGGTTR
jgi:hypothetical protein